MTSQELNLSLHSAAGNTITSDDSGGSSSISKVTVVPLRRTKSLDPLTGIGVVSSTSIIKRRKTTTATSTRKVEKKGKNSKGFNNSISSINNNEKEEEQRLVTYRKYPTTIKCRSLEGDKTHHNSTSKDYQRRQTIKQKSALGYHCQRRKHREQKKKIQLEEVQDQYIYNDDDNEDDDTCSLLSSMTSAPVTKNKTNSVSFSTVSIAEYTIKPYSNVQCCIGPAIGLDQVTTKKGPINIDLYEYVRNNERKTNINELKLSPFQREQALMNICGLSRKELNSIMQKERKYDYASSSSSLLKGSKDTSTSTSLECLLMPFILPKMKNISIQQSSSTTTLLPNKKWKNVFVTTSSQS